ncbi:hypothetical protein LTR70_006241 [Exophiala xenobiotica]|uniref:Uncharacterized protein n=1 Tax=Lithohypha guttulata TaxID=1690604 RepID=A0ABR0K3E9_9EURO|nr:hypothetical protein LTR24_007308 [Lithohypha guttulata]KAK5316582.1 hypothetical protein LTR70_006241 [Exophiala xenobiotica]
MKTFTVLLGISALFPPSVVPAREPFSSTCSKIFPEEPCFRDPEWCYRALESVKNPFGARDLQPDQNATDGIAVNFDALASCESLAGVDRTAYRQCLAMRNDPAGFADDILGLSSSELQSAILLNSTEDPAVSAGNHLTTRDFRGGCCRVTDHCYDFLQTVSDDDAMKELEYWSFDKQWSRVACCLAFWYRSCDGQDKSYPGLWFKPPQCSNPKEWGPHVGPGRRV